MARPIEFVKLSGSGNDFICIDNRDGRFDEMIRSGQVGHFARTLCRRGLGIGADGVIFAENSDLLDDVKVFARFYEPDGSQAELCGNGTACVIWWVVWQDWAGDGEIKVLTDAGMVHGHAADGRYVRVCIPQPEDLATDLELTVEGRTWRCDYLVTGVPHAITYVDCVDAIDIAHWGRRLRRHEHFQPRGANINFVEVLGEGRIAVRTFEFGVEAETLACGTGSAAAAILSTIRFGWPKKYLTSDEPVCVRARSGDVLKIWFTRRDDGAIIDVCLETVVRCICTGTIHPHVAEDALRAPGAS